MNINAILSSIPTGFRKPLIDEYNLIIQNYLEKRRYNEYCANRAVATAGIWYIACRTIPSETKASKRANLTGLLVKIK